MSLESFNRVIDDFMPPFLFWLLAFCLGGLLAYGIIDGHFQNKCEQTLLAAQLDKSALKSFSSYTGTSMCDINNNRVYQNMVMEYSKTNQITQNMIALHNASDDDQKNFILATSAGVIAGSVMTRSR